MSKTGSMDTKGFAMTVGFNLGALSGGDTVGGPLNPQGRQTRRVVLVDEHDSQRYRMVGVWGGMVGWRNPYRHDGV